MSARRRRTGPSSPPGRASSQTVSASYAAKNFGSLVAAVREAGATYVVERSGQPVVHLVPAPVRRATLADLSDLYRDPGRLAEDYLREVERGAARLNRPAVPRDPWAS